MINKCSILNGAKYFASDGQQNYLVFISLRRIDFISNNSDRFVSSISTGMSHENIKNPHNSDTTFDQELIGNYNFSRVKFKRNLFKTRLCVLL